MAQPNPNPTLADGPPVGLELTDIANAAFERFEPTPPAAANDAVTDPAGVALCDSMPTGTPLAVPADDALKNNAAVASIAPGDDLVDGLTISDAEIRDINLSDVAKPNEAEEPAHLLELVPQVMAQANAIAEHVARRLIRNDDADKTLKKLTVRHPVEAVQTIRIMMRNTGLYSTLADNTALVVMRAVMDTRQRGAVYQLDGNLRLNDVTAFMTVVAYLVLLVTPTDDIIKVVKKMLEIANALRSLAGKPSDVTPAELSILREVNGVRTGDNAGRLAKVLALFRDELNGNDAERAILEAHPRHAIATVLGNLVNLVDGHIGKAISNAITPLKLTYHGPGGKDLRTDDDDDEHVGDDYVDMASQDGIPATGDIFGPPEEAPVAETDESKDIAAQPDGAAVPIAQAAVEPNGGADQQPLEDLVAELAGVDGFDPDDMVDLELDTPAGSPAGSPAAAPRSDKLRALVRAYLDHMAINSLQVSDDQYDAARDVVRTPPRSPAVITNCLYVQSPDVVGSIRSLCTRQPYAQWRDAMGISVNDLFHVIRRLVVHVVDQLGPELEDLETLGKKPILEERCPALLNSQSNRAYAFIEHVWLRADLLTNAVERMAFVFLFPHAGAQHWRFMACFKVIETSLTTKVKSVLTYIAETFPDARITLPYDAQVRCKITPARGKGKIPDDNFPSRLSAIKGLSVLDALGEESGKPEHDNTFFDQVCAMSRHLESVRSEDGNTRPFAPVSNIVRSDDGATRLCDAIQQFDVKRWCKVHSAIAWQQETQSVFHGSFSRKVRDAIEAVCARGEMRDFLDVGNMARGPMGRMALMVLGSTLVQGLNAGVVREYFGDDGRLTRWLNTVTALVCTAYSTANTRSQQDAEKRAAVSHRMVQRALHSERVASADAAEVESRLARREAADQAVVWSDDDEDDDDESQPAVNFQGFTDPQERKNAVRLMSKRKINPNRVGGDMAVKEAMLKGDVEAVIAVPAAPSAAPPALSDGRVVHFLEAVDTHLLTNDQRLAVATAGMLVSAAISSDAAARAYRQGAEVLRATIPALMNRRPLPGGDNPAKKAKKAKALPAPNRT